MPVTLIEARAGMRELGTKAQAIVDNKSLNPTAKLAELNKLHAQLAEYKGVLAIHEGANLLAGGGNALGVDDGRFGFAKNLNRIPRFALDEAQTLSLFEAVKMKSALRIETKDAVPMDPRTDLPAQFLGGVVAAAHEPLRILDHIPASPMEGPSIEFIAHTSTVGSAGMVAAGGAKPQVQFITTPTILTARKIALWTALLDENLDDFPTFAAYIANELQRLIVDTENDQVLNGDGTGENLKGLLHQTGILTRDHTADVTADPDATGLDTMEMAIADLRTGAAFVDPDMIVMHPTTWSKLRRTKDGQGRYILNPDPSSSEANTLWGIPVLPTTTCAVGTSLVANLEKGAQAFQRKGFVIETTNSAGDAFTTNQTLFRAEERLTLGSPRPAALLKVTNL